LHNHPIYQESEIIRDFYNDLLVKVFLLFSGNFNENEYEDNTFPEVSNIKWIGDIIREEFKGSFNFSELLKHIDSNNHTIFGYNLHRVEDELESSEWEDYVMEEGEEAIVRFLSDLIRSHELRNIEEACNKIRDFIKEHSQTLGIDQPPEVFVDFETEINEVDSLGRKYNLSQAEDLDIYYFLSENANFVELRFGIPIYDPKFEYPLSRRVYISYSW